MLITVILVLIILLAWAGPFTEKVEGQLPFRLVTFGPEIQGTTPPQIIISSPNNNSESNPNQVDISLRINKPMLPSPYNSTYNGIIYYSIQLDDEIIDSWYLQSYSGSGPLGGVQAGLTEFNYNNTINIPEGKHSLHVDASGVAFASSGAFILTNNSTVIFTTTSNATSKPTNSTITSSPTVPELSWLAIVPLFALTLIGVIAVRYRFNNKKRHQIA